MRRTKEDAELTRQSVLEAAITEFSQNGYTATRLEDIAKSANVTRGAVYHHFNGGKSELFGNIIEQATQTGNQAIGRAIQEGGPFLDIIRRVLIYALELLSQDSQFRAAMRLLIFNSGDSPDLTLMRTARMEQGIVQMEQIAGFFGMALENGTVRPDLDPQIAARAFLAYQNGLILLWLSSPGIIDVEKHAAGLADVFANGISSE